jgi:hypothetical protein
MAEPALVRGLDRTLGSLPIAHPTASTVSCLPDTLAVGQSTTCTATITDTASSGQTTPTGMVSFASSGAGSFSGAGSCTLSGNGASASCKAAYTPSATGTPLRSDTITATYGGDPTHTNISGSTTVTVQPTSKQDCVDGRYHNYGFPNQGQCIKIRQPLRLAETTPLGECRWATDALPA